jgi:hypothetical protein
MIIVRKLKHSGRVRWSRSNAREEIGYKKLFFVGFGLGTVYVVFLESLNNRAKS